MLEKHEQIIEVLSTFTNSLFEKLYIFIFLGIVYILILEWKTVIDVYRKKDKIVNPAYFYSISKSIIERLYYIAYGLIVFFAGYSVVYFISDIFGNSKYSFNYIDENNFILPVAGMIAVFVFQLAGITLILSAGDRFFVNTAKTITVITVGLLLVFLVLTHAQVI